ncbi:hypothetical protein [Marivirga sp.]|uniref:hypothetical protein n=1 Tax=Marivirga sp. TaxID=2018662 RepID=UPI003DA7956F
MKLIDTIDQLARDLIGKTGGVKGNGKELFNSCAKIDNLKSVFDNYKVNKIEILYNQLDETEKSNEIRKELNEFIYNEKAYFDKSYFQNQNITNLTFDLMTLELILIN